MQHVLALILGGGTGTRLFPLTSYRSKPAVPLAGKYRLIDVPISNCINSGLNRIYVLTQFNSVSLHRHIRQAYNFDHFRGGFVEILAAQQTIEQTDWYQGTADAVRKQLRYFDQPDVEHVLILSGDQLYRMDFAHMLDAHQRSGADVTISAVPVHREAAKAFGIMRMEESGRVVGFLEKPETDDELELVHTDPKWLEHQGIQAAGREYLASMGIYLFKKSTLVELVGKSDYQDFGKDIFPMAIRTRHVQALLFDGYWEDIGTIRTFYEANLALCLPAPSFEFAAPESPVYTRARFLPPTRIDDATVKNTLVADGCSIGPGSVIENSIIGLRCNIGRNVHIRNSIVMGADEYERTENPTIIPLGIGDETTVETAIIDKDCRIGRGARIHPSGTDSPNTDGPVTVCEGIIVVRKGQVLPDGWSL